MCSSLSRRRSKSGKSRFTRCDDAGRDGRPYLINAPFQGYFHTCYSYTGTCSPVKCGQLALEATGELNDQQENCLQEQAQEQQSAVCFMHEMGRPLSRSDLGSGEKWVGSRTRPHNPGRPRMRQSSCVSEAPHFARHSQHEHAMSLPTTNSSAFSTHFPESTSPKHGMQLPPVLDLFRVSRSNQTITSPFDPDQQPPSKKCHHPRHLPRRSSFQTPKVRHPPAPSKSCYPPPPPPRAEKAKTPNPKNHQPTPVLINLPPKNILSPNNLAHKMTDLTIPKSARGPGAREQGKRDGSSSSSENKKKNSVHPKTV